MEEPENARRRRLRLQLPPPTPPGQPRSLRPSPAVPARRARHGLVRHQSRPEPPVPVPIFIAVLSNPPHLDLRPNRLSLHHTPTPRARSRRSPLQPRPAAHNRRHRSSIPAAKLRFRRRTEKPAITNIIVVVVDDNSNPNLNSPLPPLPPRSLEMQLPQHLFAPRGGAARLRLRGHPEEPYGLLRAVEGLGFPEYA